MSLISFGVAVVPGGLANHSYTFKLLDDPSAKLCTAAWKDRTQYVLERSVISCSLKETSSPAVASRTATNNSGTMADIADSYSLLGGDKAMIKEKMEPKINSEELRPNLESTSETGSDSEQTMDTTNNAEPSKDDRRLSNIWRQIQGESNWEGMLEHPIDPVLRSELIRYGEFAQICYDAFDYDKHSIYCGSCKYNRMKLLEKMDKGDCGYTVTKYLYATSKLDLPKFFRKSDRAKARWSGDSNWMGYVAVVTDEKMIEELGRRDIVVAWRGTVTATEWINDLMDVQTEAGLELDHKEVKVEGGFLSLYVSSKDGSRFNKQSAREQLITEVRRLLKEYEAERVSVTVTGHSLGGALALLSAYDIAVAVQAMVRETSTEEFEPAAAKNDAGDIAEKSGRAAGKLEESYVPITVFSFSAPRVGNLAFKNRVEELGVKVLRVVNVHDTVPNVPGIFFNENSFVAAAAAVAASGGGFFRRLGAAWIWTYHHVGARLLLDVASSPHLRRTRDPACHHNLEAHLHVLDGYQGSSRAFESVTGRSVALVNKSSDFLHARTFIPPFWWQDMNKGLVKDEHGHWVLASRDDEHLPHNHHLPPSPNSDPPISQP